MFELPNQPSCSVLLIANAHDIIQMNQVDDDTDWEEISDDGSEDPVMLTLLSDIEPDNVHKQQENLHLQPAGHKEKTQNTTGPL
jgi:hypothetical protein